MEKENHQMIIIQQYQQSTPSSSSLSSLVFVEIQCCNTAILTNTEFIGFDQIISRSVFVVFLDPAGSMLLSKCFGLQTSIRSFYVADLVGAI